MWSLLSSWAPEGMPRLLVLHEDAPTLLHTKRVFEATPGVRVTGARTSDHAMRRVEAERYGAVLLHWSLPRHDALKFLCRLHDEVSRARRPPVLAYVESWRSADLRRALQLGVDAVLTTPLEPLKVATELEAITAHGEGASIRQLLTHASAVLLRHDPSLWMLDLPAEWQERMLALAAVLREHRTGRSAFPPTVVTVVEALAPELPADVDVDRLKVLLGGAMREVFEVDTERLKGLLPPELVVEPLSDAAKARLKALRAQVGMAVDHLKLLRMKADFDPLLALCPEVDYEALRRLLAELPPDGTTLTPGALDRLRVLAALLSEARHPVRVVEAWVAVAQPAEAQTEVLDRLLQALEAEEARQALWGVIAESEVTVDAVRGQLEAGDLTRALRSARALPDSEQEKPALLNNVGLALRGAGAYEPAESAYLDALRLREDSPSLMFNLAVVKHDQHAYAEALRLVQQVLERQPKMERAERLRTELRSAMAAKA